MTSVPVFPSQYGRQNSNSRVHCLNYTRCETYFHLHTPLFHVSRFTPFASSVCGPVYTFGRTLWMTDVRYTACTYTRHYKKKRRAYIYILMPRMEFETAIPM